MTNADRIRAMSDKELERFLCSTNTSSSCAYCRWEKDSLFEDCTLSKWLKREIKLIEKENAWKD